jgi:hypothetical protein
MPNRFIRFKSYLRRYVMRWTIRALILTGAIAGASTAYLYYDANYGWYVGILSVCIGLGTALFAWAMAAFLGLFVEAVNALRDLNKHLA